MRLFVRERRMRKVEYKDRLRDFTDQYRTGLHKYEDQIIADACHDVLMDAFVKLAAEIAVRRLVSGTLRMAETETIEKPAEKTEEPKEKEKPDLDKENSRDIGQKPPESGKCKICGFERALNQHRVCYPCYVSENLKDHFKKMGKEWNVGDPHPAWCDCEGLGEHKNPDGSFRGNN